MNTGRFVGSRSKTSTARLEDTITKNNLEAVKEVVRQLRLRDIGGIIVIDFIDMANPKNRATVEEALRTELERDRTKTYVVEISPLGLVEMTRQNVTDGPREILTKKCPTCAGDGIVLSEASAAVEVERRLRTLAAGSRAQAFQVEVNPKTASLLVGPGASRLIEIEAATKKRFFLVPKEGVHLDHAAVLAEGKLEALRPEAPVEEGKQVEVKLVELGLHDGGAAVGKLDGIDVVVGGAAKLVGKKAKVRIERVLDGVAYASLLAGGAVRPGADHVRERGREADARAQRGPKKTDAEARPKRRGRRAAIAPRRPRCEATAETELERGRGRRAGARQTRGGRGWRRRSRPTSPRTARSPRRRRRRPAAAHAAAATASASLQASRGGARTRPPRARRSRSRTSPRPSAPKAPRIHVPDLELDEKPTKRRRREGRALEAEAPAAEADPVEEAEEVELEQRRGRRGAGRRRGPSTTVKKKTRRGSRGGRGRKKTPAAAAAAAGAAGSDNGAEPTAEQRDVGETAASSPSRSRSRRARRLRPSRSRPRRRRTESDDYVPMSEWLDELGQLT